MPDCIGVSLKGNGELACGIIGGAVGGAAGGSFSGEFGGFLGGRVLEVDGNLIFQPEGT
jgi:fructose-specific phosphotransferase system IIC component